MSEYHIHIDASRIDNNLLNSLYSIGFTNKDFIDCKKEKCYSPKKHITQKYFNPKEFNNDYSIIIDQVNSGSLIDGYIEGEYISNDHVIPYHKYNKEEIPFTFELGEVDRESFKEAEIHITFHKDKSDQQAIDALYKIGFVPAYMEKSYGIAQIMTVTGKKRDISSIEKNLVEYMKTMGGLEKCTVKIEYITGYWKSSNELELAPEIKKVKYTSPPK